MALVHTTSCATLCNKNIDASWGLRVLFQCEFNERREGRIGGRKISLQNEFWQDDYKEKAPLSLPIQALCIHLFLEANLFFFFLKLSFSVLISS